MILLSLSPSQTLSHHPFPHLFVAVSDTSYSALYNICQIALLMLIECWMNRHVNKPVLQWRRRRSAERSQNDQRIIGKWMTDRTFCLTTPTPGSLKYIDKLLFHGRVNPVNLSCWWSNNKYYTIISFPCEFSSSPLESSVLQSCNHHKMNHLKI